MFAAVWLRVGAIRGSKEYQNNEKEPIEHSFPPVS